MGSNEKIHKNEIKPLEFEKYTYGVADALKII